MEYIVRLMSQEVRDTSTASVPSCAGIAALLLFVALVFAGCSSAIGQVDRPIPTEILERAATEGRVRVIVELKVDDRGIQETQEEVLRGLAGTDHRVTRRYTEVPFLALEVSPVALQILATSPFVLRIQEDRVVTPQQGKTP